jgi:hypothetical protein
LQVARGKSSKSYRLTKTHDSHEAAVQFYGPNWKELVLCNGPGIFAVQSSEDENHWYMVKWRSDCNCRQEVRLQLSI